MDTLYTVPILSVKSFFGAGPDFLASVTRSGLRHRRPPPWRARCPALVPPGPLCGRGPPTAPRGCARGVPALSSRAPGGGRLGAESLSDHLLVLRSPEKSRTYNVSAGSGLGPVMGDPATDARFPVLVASRPHAHRRPAGRRPFLWLLLVASSLPGKEPFPRPRGSDTIPIAGGTPEIAGCPPSEVSYAGRRKPR